MSRDEARYRAGCLEMRLDSGQGARVSRDEARYRAGCLEMRLDTGQGVSG